MRLIQTFAFAALAATSLTASALAADALSVPVDQAVRVDVGGFVDSVVIANPSVADVRVVDSHTFYLIGNGYGSTNVIALDRDGRSVYATDILVTSGNTGRVSVFRGSNRTDMACASNCQPSMRSAGGAGAAGGGAAGGGGGQKSGGGMAGALGAALGTP